MPVRNQVIETLQFAKLVTWSGLLITDNGDAFEAAEFGDRAVQVAGTFGVGGSVNIEGSNNGVAWAVLADPQGTPLTFTAARIEQVLESPRFIRPIITAGDGTTNLTVNVFCRRSLK